MRTVNDIRSTFLDYFEKQGHAVLPSSPLVPRNDPTLMFANSGMVQFKNLFTGVENRSYTRATTAQKCVRAGGKLLAGRITNFYSLFSGLAMLYIHIILTYMYICIGCYISIGFCISIGCYIFQLF